jgi:hypothetical protein
MGFQFAGWIEGRKKRNQSELTELEVIEEESGLIGNQIERKSWLICENLKSLEQEEVYWY